MKVRLLLCGAAFASLLAAQDRDFLTPNEVDQVREAQDPNDRLALYVHFAKQRMDLVEQYVAKEKPGRSIFIHNTLEDYSKIIEAIDSVADDALRRKLEIDKGMIAVVNAEKDFLDRLNKIRDKQPSDLDRYQFVLDDAIDTTSDSRELSMEDSHKRGSELATEDAKEKREREAMMPSKEVQDRKKQEGAQSGDQQQQKKIPSLYRPGEKHQEPK
ncbi:MAG TPA: hypothetical protein VFB14_13875 [Bryobacteraceae bacterium]|jgi:RNA binding exosome subunit|nr:hypothetical protein [Bryobacteraceae bacterium]